MTRIISGAAGSIVLAVPDAGTRPTSDRVRESLFGALESLDAFRHARVLDLYAGSGALGLEAASRGAASVSLVELSAKAAGIAERNAAKVVRAIGGSRVRVHPVAADVFLRRTDEMFDLVFLDPPYDLGEEALAGTLALVAGVTSPDAWIVVERASRSPQPQAGGALELSRSKRYGDTALWWFQPRPASQSR